jgi:8-oxo-dGTP pyrophosphatase MutT (NUDIX family)
MCRYPYYYAHKSAPYIKLGHTLERVQRSIMAEKLIFGSPEPNVQYTERRAAYVLIVTDNGQVATVKSQQNRFLPGGGSLPGEAPEDTVVREVREELARGVRLIRRIGEATQYFYSTADDRHYRMRAVFFTGEFTDGPCGGTGEHELDWLPVAEVEHAFFHACHAWAVRQA